MSFPIRDVEHPGIMSPPSPIRLSKDGQIGVEAVVSINQTLSSLVKHINSGLSVGTAANGARVGNFNNQWLTFTTPSVADTEFEMPHGLERTPVGFTTWFVDKAAIIYVSRYGSWNRDRILLKCNVATVEAVIELA